jgi:DNA-binding NarL/FixJ family response regulator
MTVRTLIADDHALVSQGLEVMLSGIDDVELVATVDSGELAVGHAQTSDVDLILMDINLGTGISGIEATKQIKSSSPETKVLILTMFTDPGTVAEAIKAGADGYVSKGASREVLAQAIQDVAEGRSVLDPNVTEGIFDRIGGRPANILSDRELGVLQELTHGRTTREIAEKLFVSEETIKTHLKQIFRKLKVRDRTEAVAEAFRRGLVH